MKKSTLGIVITDGVGYRNFILSNFLREVGQLYTHTIIYSCLPESSYPQSVREQAEIIELPIFTEGILTWFIRKIKEVAHLTQFQHHNFGMYDNLQSNKNRRYSVKGILTRIAFLAASLAHSEKSIIRWTNLQMWSIRKHPITQNYLSLLVIHEPSVLFFTHQRPPFVAPMIAAARQSGIPTAAFIFSWDNLPSKGRMAGIFDSYIVWSELMKTELLAFYPSVKPQNVFIGGTPQFEPYVMHEYMDSSQSFRERFGIHNLYPIVCFSCGDISTSKNDELYISTIAEALQKNEFSTPINLLVRTSPAEAPDRFLSIRERYPFILWNFPEWIYARENHPEPWTQRIPTAKDMRDLRSILTYCDVSVNMCSTMSLDFMHFDKPVINPVFGNEQNGLYNDQRFLKYAHYERVAKSGAVSIVRTEKELITTINKALSHPEEQHNQRQELLHIQIGHPLEGTSKHIANILKKIAE